MVLTDFECIVSQYAAASQAYEAGCYGAGDMRVLAAAGQAIQRHLAEAEARVAAAEAVLEQRAEEAAGDPGAARALLKALLRALKRCAFAAAYAAADAGAPDWQQLTEILCGEGCLEQDTDPAVRALFDACSSQGRLLRVLWEHGLDPGEATASGC